MASKRILVLGPPKSGKFTLIKELTGSFPASAPSDQDTRTSHAGLSHTLQLKNKYFESEIPIWIDEYDNEDEHNGISAWASSFSSDDAHEVVSALGAIVFPFRKPLTAEEHKATREQITKDIQIIHDTLITHYKKRTTEIDDETDEDDLIDWDGVCLAVAVPHSAKPGSSVELDPEEWDALLQPFGFEFIDIEKSGHNEYGELMGLERIRQALETFSWGATDDAIRSRQSRLLSGYDEFDSDLVGDDYDEDLDSEGFDQELREMQLEMAALHFAIDGDQTEGPDKPPKDDDEESDRPTTEKDVEDLEKLMQRMKSVREQGEGLPLEERKKLADQLVGDLMRLL